MSMNDFEVAPRGSLKELLAFEERVKDLTAQADAARRDEQKWKDALSAANDRLHRAEALIRSMMPDVQKGYIDDASTARWHEAYAFLKEGI